MKVENHDHMVWILYTSDPPLYMYLLLLLFKSFIYQYHFPIADRVITSRHYKRSDHKNSFKVGIMCEIRVLVSVSSRRKYRWQNTTYLIQLRYDFTCKDLE